MPDADNLDVLRAKWERFDKRLTEGDSDGSLVGASFIIARSGVTDVLALVQQVESIRGLHAAGCIDTVKALRVEVERLVGALHTIRDMGFNGPQREAASTALADGGFD